MLSSFVKMNAWMKFQSDSKMNKLCEWQNMRITLVQWGGGLGAKKLSIKSQHEYECHRHWQKMWRRVCRMFYKLENIPSVCSKIVCSINHNMWCYPLMLCLLSASFSFTFVLISQQTRTRQTLRLDSKLVNLKANSVGRMHFEWL